jgi:glycosyltransferase involved in cell wall biosynthesis
MNKGLVSVITPCYNAEKVIHRLLNSILEQTYKKIEFIIINDGSTDNSGEIIKSYIKKFEDIGIIVIYIYQENRGLGGAINTGLKHFTGEYLCWPDADDFLSKDSIEKKKLFLDSHLDYNLVRSDALLFEEKNLEKPIGFITGKKNNRFREKDLFENYILEKDVIFCPGCHMVRSSAFIEVNPRREIYPARRGQNYQMLLPLVYKYKFAFIDEPLYNYVIYKESMSKGDNTYEKCIYRYDGIKTIILETLKVIPLSKEEKIYYEQLVEFRYLHLKCSAAFKFSQKDKFIVFHTELQKQKQLFKREKIKRFMIEFPILIKIWNYVRKNRH